MAEKFCIFCGKKPENKNMEHVIPQWLIKLTGREHSDVFSFFPQDEKHLTFMNFKFPACESCNTKYAALEYVVKPIMEKVLSNGTITGKEASLLMDWFDKIRIGLWLTNMFYDKDLRNNVKPHMFIDSRVGRKDRMLSIQKLDMPESSHGILFFGTNTDLFNYAPCSFTMIINNYYFFNASVDGLVSQRVGFPYISEAKLINSDTGVYNADIAPGTNRVVNPIIQTYIPPQRAVTFYQPIFNFLQPKSKIFDNDYVSQHCYDTQNGIGGVFVQRGSVANTRYLNPDDRCGLHLKPLDKFPCMQEDGLKFQLAIQKKNLLTSPITENLVKMNQIMLSQIQK